MFAAIERQRTRQAPAGALRPRRTEEERTIATGYFNGDHASRPKAPRSSTALATSETFPPKSDIYRVSTGEGRTEGDHHATTTRPTRCGAAGQIAFVKRARRQDPQVRAEERDLPDGPPGQERPPPHPHHGQPAARPGPAADRVVGKRRRLLTEFGGQDNTYAVTVKSQNRGPKAAGRRNRAGLHRRGAVEKRPGRARHRRRLRRHRTQGRHVPSAAASRRSS